MKICTKYAIGFVFFAVWAVALYTNHVAASAVTLASLVGYLGVLAFRHENRRHAAHSAAELSPRFAEE